MTVDALRHANSGGKPSHPDEYDHESASTQRACIVSAARQSLSEHPAEKLTLARVCAAAGMSRTELFNSFADRDELLLATFDDVARSTGTAMERARRTESSWVGGVRAGLTELLRLLDGDPGLARFLIAGSLAGNTRLLMRRARAVSVLAGVLEDGAPPLSGETLPAPFGGEAVVGAVVAILHARLLEEPTPPLAPLRGSLMSVIVLPYLGVAAAREELADSLPSRSTVARASRPRQRAPSGPSRSGKRAGQREMQALAVIAERPGLTNREIATALEIRDPAQISRLLARLHRRGLLKDDAANRRGSSKAWRLTRSGARALAEIASQVASGRSPGIGREDE
jgi:AcrR family transcriptional regulator